MKPKEQILNFIKKPMKMHLNPILPKVVKDLVKNRSRLKSSGNCSTE